MEKPGYGLPEGLYNDGTYDWEWDGEDWTPIHAPSGMPSQPQKNRLRKVHVFYGPVLFSDLPVPGPLPYRKDGYATRDPEPWARFDGTRAASNGVNLYGSGYTFEPRPEYDVDKEDEED